jgi:hypothetical protein
MVNEFKYDQWNIDTQTTDPAKVTALFTKVRSIKWVSVSANAGDRVQITDGAGFVLWESVASGSNYEVETFVERTWKSGFAVPDLDSGTLYITIRTVR